jgi:RNA polymerase sigma factor (sigma-70 family)
MSVRMVVRAKHVPRGDADDLVGKVMCIVVGRWRAASHAIRDLRAYACTVARRECGKLCKRNMAREMPCERLDDLPRDADRLTTDYGPDHDAACAAMCALYDTIRSPHRRAVFQLHFLHRRSVREIAQELGFQVQHVNRHVTAILRHARRVGNLSPKWTA